MNIYFYLRKNLQSIIYTVIFSTPMILGGLVGVLTGVVIVAFLKCIEFSQNLFFGEISGHLSFLGNYSIILIPAIGAGLVGLLIYFFGASVSGHGITGVLEAITFQRGKLPAKLIFIKPLLSAISIGSGSSVGREGPAVEIGSSVGSLIGRLFKLSDAKIKNLIACGAAAGISAVFNAPITGVMFASEVVLKDLGTRTLGSIVIASVAGSIIVKTFLGDSFALKVPVFSIHSPTEILLYILLGLISALAAVFFITTLDRCESYFRSLKLTIWTKAIIGGILVGGIGFFFPQILGMGFETINETFQGRFDFRILFFLALFKILATSISLGSGSSGGTFGPSLFIGAVLGAAMGKMGAAHFSFPIEPGAYALVGMASVFAGTFHSPITAIFLVFELTGDHHMILPIMISSVISTSVSQLLTRDSMNTIKLKAKGINIEALEEVKILNALRVEDVMVKNFSLITEKASIKDLNDELAKNKDNYIFVVNAHGGLKGTIKNEEFETILLKENAGTTTVGDLTTTLTDYVFLNEPVSDAAKLMLANNIKVLPVVNLSFPAKIVGIIKSENIFNAYTNLATKRSELIDRLERENPHEEGMIYMQFVVSPHSPIAGKSVRDLDLPEAVLLTSIKRNKSIFIPEGNSLLEIKDKVSAGVLPSNQQTLIEWLKKNKIKIFYT